MRRFFGFALAIMFLAACGDSAGGGPPADAGPGAPGIDAQIDASTATPDADATSTMADVDSGTAAPDVDATTPDADARAGDGDAVACTSITAYTEPTTCACFFAGSCPIVDGGRSRECLWAETPTTVTGQPTCRGCGLIAFKPNPCNKCRETFTCACLAAYLDPGQRCCDGIGGPYLTDYACP